MSSTAEVAPPVTSVAEAIDRMEAITSEAPEHDGLARFNVLYTDITTTVATGLGDGTFLDVEFLDRLDVVFANRYFDALRKWGTDRRDEVPRVWRVLLERRDDPRVNEIQFVVAGVNAHINFDLAASLDQTCAEIGAPLGHGDQRVDYDEINDIFDARYKLLRDEFTVGLVDEIDEGRVARALDFVSNFVVTSARDEAWESAERIVVRRQNRDDEGIARLMNRLDRTFGVVARGLLMRGLF